jgi:UDP-N-acetylmuramoyl-tripeptide--D-alanyl-D-alanine ligase
VNEDDAFAAYWKGLNAGRTVLTFGFAPGAEVRAAAAAGGETLITTPAGPFKVSLQVAGEHNVRNALAACAVAHALGVPQRAMQHALSRFAGVPGRLQRRRAVSGAWVIDDSYNANPESMKAAVRVLAAEPARRVFAMGDMGELGDQSAALHAEVGSFAREAGIDALLALGEASRRAVEAFGPKGRHFSDIDAITAAAHAESSAGATVLVKGSRFMRMERVADALVGEEGGHAA